MPDIPKCLADYCDDRRFVDRKFSRRANVQGESRPRPTENGFANFTPGGTMTEVLMASVESANDA
jgi:hypothetical protein